MYFETYIRLTKFMMIAKKVENFDEESWFPLNRSDQFIVKKSEFKTWQMKKQKYLGRFSIVDIFSAKVNPNWHEEGHFPPPVFFWIKFCQQIF